MAILQIPISKGKAGVLDLETEMVPEDLFRYLVILGAKSVLGRGMTKIDKDDKEAIMEKAQTNLEALYAGKTRMVGAGRPTKVSGAIMVEARRLAKQAVKDGLKAAGEKVSRYAAKDITAAANALIETEPEYLELAKANVAARGVAKKVDVTKLGILGKTKPAEEKVGSAGNITKGAMQKRPSLTQ